MSWVDREFLYNYIVPYPHPARSDHCTGCRMQKCMACEADQFNLDPLIKLENEIIFKNISFNIKSFTTELLFNQNKTNYSVIIEKLSLYENVLKEK